MTDLQAWTLIGVFTTIMLGGMTLMTMVINARVDGLRGEMNGLRGEMNARFEATNAKIDHLDRDVAALSRRMWDGSTGD